MNLSLRCMTLCVFTIFSLLFFGKSIEAQTSPCWENTTTDCETGTSAACSTCQKWYLNPNTNQWQLTGKEAWTTKLECATPGANVYTNTQDIPTVRQLASNEGPGQEDRKDLGDVLCITFFGCNCIGPNMVHGSLCNVGPNPAENKIESEETEGDACHDGIE